MTTLQALADRVTQGEALRDDDAALLVASHDLITIGMMADAVRRGLHGLETTFVRVLEVHVDAVPATLPSGVSAGEIRLVGRPSSIEAACGAVERTRNLDPEVALTGFSLADLDEMERSVPGALSRLKDAGLEMVAEVPVDHAGEAAVRVARAAGLRVERLTVRAQPTDPAAVVRAARELQAAVGGFRTFAPLPRSWAAATPATGYDDVKLVALARLLLQNIVTSIQVDWPLYGPKLAQVALTMGADDVDGIAAVESGTLGTRRSAIEEIRSNIRAAGLQAVERTGRFEVRAAR